MCYRSGVKDHVLPHLTLHCYSLLREKEARAMKVKLDGKHPNVIFKSKVLI